MPPKVKFTREEIIRAALDIVRETGPEGLTQSEIRRARRLCERVTSPTIGWTIVFCLRAGFLVAGFDFGFRVAG